ncbi:MAG: nuclear transport factor 2 family protein [Acidobacteriota bacterium]|nr:nuclear transport factor 2 family protein [Acidobacteriota bacterium]
MTNWGNALPRRDVAAIEKILPPNEFMLKGADGKIHNREQYLDAVKSFPNDVTVSGKPEKTMVMGETAVSTGTYSVTPKAGGQPTSYNYTATFVRRVGRWVPVAFYTAAAEKK